MSNVSLELPTGARVRHSELGIGIFLGADSTGYARVFFQDVGERQVALAALTFALTWDEEVLSNIGSSGNRGGKWQKTDMLILMGS